MKKLLFLFVALNSRSEKFLNHQRNKVCGHCSGVKYEL